jgi:hypothetical protein
MRGKGLKASVLVFLFWISILIPPAEAANPTFTAQEDLVYNEFMSPYYPDGMRSGWNGVYATYLDWHTNDNTAVWVNKNHEVSTESTSLMALCAALRGDQAAFDQMYDLWASENYFLSQRFQLEHWLLDPWGSKIDNNGDCANASGEEVRMIEVLKIAYDKFTPTPGRDYRQMAINLAEGLKGLNGGQGNFEQPYAYATDAGDGGTDYINFEPQITRYLRINCLERTTQWGDSLFEVEVFGPDTGTLNFALTATATASSIEGQGLEADKAIDGNLSTRWSSQFFDPQYLELDLGAEYNIDEVVLHWEAASAKTYNIDLTPYYQPKEADGHLLRPWFIWRTDEMPVSKPWDPVRVALNYNNFVSYYDAANWLNDPFYQDVLDYSLSIVEGSQNTDPASSGKGLFKTKYDISRHQYLSEYGDNACTTIAGCDIATRLGIYGHLVSDQNAINAGRMYLDFLKAKYINDGAIFASYDYDTGEPVDRNQGFVLYSFFARLAVEYAEYDLTEKMLREQILPYQVDDPSDPGYEEGYYGAFKARATRAESQEDIWKDASAFANFETLLALHKWNDTDKGPWNSSYPLGWTTVAAVSGSDGGEDIVDFNTVNARYIKVLCGNHSLPAYGYSMFTLNIFSPEMVDEALNKQVSTSSVENYDYIGPKAVDNNDSTRWSSEFKIDPQWIYVDLGTDKVINRARVLWEAAYATDYEIQVVPVADTVNITRAEWSVSRRRLTVEATSTKSPYPALTTVNFGPMIYNESTGRYAATYYNVQSNPGTVTVTSSFGGSATGTVIRKR